MFCRCVSGALHPILPPRIPLLWLEKLPTEARDAAQAKGVSGWSWQSTRARSMPGACRRTHHTAGKPASPTTKTVCPTFVTMFSIPVESKAASATQINPLNPVYLYTVYWHWERSGHCWTREWINTFKFFKKGQQMYQTMCFLKLLQSATGGLTRSRDEVKDKFTKPAPGKSQVL